jgi:hypothetical protein
MRLSFDTAASIADSTSFALAGWLVTSPYLLELQHPAAWVVLMLAAVILAMEVHASTLPLLLRLAALLAAALLLLAGPWTLGFAQERAALWDATFPGLALLLCASLGWRRLRRGGFDGD